jgi:hypothetical protein
MAERALVRVSTVDDKGDLGGFGSGFFLSPDGLLATNFHVIQGAQSLRITTAGGVVHEDVYLAAFDRANDLALLKIQTMTPGHLSLEADTQLRIGQRVYLMSNPMGLNGTFSDGIVSALRTFQDVDVIQTTAPMSRGSSGGPLINTRGRVVGVASSTMADGNGLNMAIPAAVLAGMIQAVDPQPFHPRLLPDPVQMFWEDNRARAVGPMAEVYADLRRYSEVLEASGLRPFGSVLFGELGTAQMETWPLHLMPGRRYAIIGVCRGCVDMDLAIMDAAGRMVTADVDTDPTPVIMITSTDARPYRVVVAMPDCPVGSCRYGAAVLAR